MRLLSTMGVGQAVLPPGPRPDLELLRRVGFTGDDTSVLARARRDAPALLSAAFSASAMWAANAATAAPSSDTTDGRVHLVPANLVSMLHRSREAAPTTRALRRIFADPGHYVVHEPLPATELLSDEGAANHTRLATASGVLHLFGWGRARDVALRPSVHPARQTREASEAVARLLALRDGLAITRQQSPHGIDRGAFHSDVLAVGSEGFLMLHEDAFLESRSLLGALGARLGEGFSFAVAGADELGLDEAVHSYAFNSQIVTLPSGAMAIVAPREAEAAASSRRFLERVVADQNPVGALHYVDVNDSMRNGGGPACLRLRVRLNETEERALAGRVLFDEALDRALTACVESRYRDRLTLDDFTDPAFVAECQTTLDELTTILGLGSVYDFQRSASETP